MYKKIVSLSLMFLLIGQASFLFAGNDDSEEKADEIRKKATELLRETSSLAVMLNSPSNRINFTVSTADALWGLDKNEATSMFNLAIEDVRKMISQIDAELNFASTSPTSNFPNRRGRNSRYSKINQVLSWRTSIVNSLSNRDAEWAMQFVNETSQMATNANFKRRIDQSNRGLKSRLARKIAEQDVSKAIEYGKERLSKGISNDVLNILQKIYYKDPEKGREFGEEVVSKITSTKLNRNMTWMLVRLFQSGINSNSYAEKNNAAPLFTDSSMRTIGEKLAEQVVSPTSRYRSLSNRVIQGLEKYAPQSATQVKTVIEQRRNNINNRRNRNRNRPPIPNSNRSNQINAANLQKEISQTMAKIRSKDTPKEEKVSMINDLQNKILTQTNERMMFNNLIWLSSTAKSIDENEKASEILSEAERFVNQDPKKKNDFSENRSLANAYASIDPDKTFQILENMAYRLNGVIDGYIKYMEYSNNQRVVENGELVMNNYSRQFTNYFNLSSNSLKNLAANDFNRIKDLSDKFERPEVRIATRLIIAKSLLRSNQGNSITFSSGSVRVNGRF